MPPWYLERLPAAPVAAPLVCTWTADVGGEPRSLIPDACLDLVWVDSGSFVLCGPETSSWSFALPPGTTAVGVRFRPGIAAGVLGIDASELRNRRVPIAAVWGDGRARRLGERLGEARTPAARVSLLEQAVGRRADDAPPIDPVAAEVAAHLGRGRAADRATPVAALARLVGLSERQLLRRCSAAFGYGPVVLARILRVQRFLALARRHGTAAGLAQLALAAGYADQPHLSREVRAIAGTTPAAIVSDPFKTPGPTDATIEP